MPEVSIKNQVEKLIELQKVDTEVYVFDVELQKKPEKIAELQTEFEEKKAHLHALEGKLKDIQLKRKEQELELKEREDHIAKSNAQLSLIKTNREYTAKIGEIEGLKADMSVIEEKILNDYEEVDAVLKVIEQEKEVVAQEEKKFLENKVKIEEEIKVVIEDSKELREHRKQMLEGIDPNYLARYDRLLKHKEGIAIVPVNGSSCGGCFMNVTQQMFNEIKIQDHLVECEMCSRILYLEDEG
ncbi:hypothetical protein MNBD_UNCLBAC01-1969 [hydrothermal vent metagenome]|uniref:C4-type zinc ribbon domain-containing protein n=1 Tax=hydrothermal vent metagenome TaxID=652676 RepID=A0A3B1DII6_9ZZZZ